MYLPEALCFHSCTMNVIIHTASTWVLSTEMGAGSWRADAYPEPSCRNIEAGHRSASDWGRKAILCQRTIGTSQCIIQLID